MEVGKYFHFHDGNGEIIAKIISFNPNDKYRVNGSFISSMNGPGWEFRINSQFWHHGRNERLATEEEIQWLDACIFADKFLDKTEIPEICLTKILKKLE